MDFDAFYRDTSRRLARYAYGLTGDPVETQDLVQEAYARAWQRWRRLGVRRARAAAEPPPPAVAAPSEDTVLLVEAMRSLPMDHRRALALYYLLDRSVAEIAAETGVATGTVKSWLSRGRAELAAALGPLEPALTREGRPDAH